MTSNKEERLPAEWEKQECVMLSWPHPGTDWNYMLEEAEDCFARIAEAISRRAHLLIVCPEPERVRKSIAGKVDESRLKILSLPTNDTWARDFGPITLMGKKAPVLCDFQFNGWGMKFAACYDNLVNTSLQQEGIWGEEMRDYRMMVLEGGSIDSDGQGTLLTTTECLLAPNRNDTWDLEEIDERLKRILHAKRIFYLEHGYLEGDDTDSHVDTLARFLPGDAICYSICDRPEDEHFHELKAMEDELKEATTIQGIPYRLIPLPIPNPIYDTEGNRLPATYANFLILNGAILLPIYSDEKYDALAIRKLEEACPGYEIVPIECTPLIQQHGSLHCVTMQLPFLPEAFKKDFDASSTKR